MNVSIQVNLATLLSAIDRPDEAKSHIDAAIDLENSPTAADEGAVFLAPYNGDYAAGLKALRNPRIDMPATYRNAVVQSFEALISGDPAAARAAAQALLALPSDMKDSFVPNLLGLLGANWEALQTISDFYSKHFYDAPAMLFVPHSGAVLRDPAVIPLLQRFGLLNYWRKTHTEPDACSEKHPPPFCQMI